MSDKIHDKELAELKADIMSLREQIASLAAGLNASARANPKSAQEEDTPARDGQDKEEESHGVWEDLLRKFNTSRDQGEKVVKGLSSEIERHPLVSVVAAFGLGYLIAKLWHEEKK